MITLSKKEAVINIALIEFIILMLGRLFYGTFVAGLILTPVTFLLFKERRKDILQKKRDVLETQFKDMLISVSDSLSTGYSMENAIIESYKDLLNIYGYDSVICREQRLMVSRLKLNVNVQVVVKDFAERSGLESATLFYEIFTVVKKTGGNIPENIKRVTDNIVLKHQLKEDINVSINEKKIEQKIMTAIPLFMIMYVNFSSPGFLDVMYDTWMGRIIMSICVICYIGAYIWAERIISIKV